MAGSVDAIESDSITVSSCARTGCVACDDGSGCGLGPLLLLFAPARGRRIRMRVSASGDYRVGDRIVVRFGARRLVALAVVAYGLPLFGLLAGAALGGALLPTGGDIAVAVGAVSGIGVVWAMLRFAGIERGLRRNLNVVRRAGS